MAKPDHKIVCWGDYAIPVPLWAKWMAWDKHHIDGDGIVWVFEDEPTAEGTYWDPGLYPGKFRCVAYPTTAPPQPGPWHTQLYWIGD